VEAIVDFGKIDFQTFSISKQRCLRAGISVEGQWGLRLSASLSLVHGWEWRVAQRHLRVLL
jgi:hypothetical protein